MNRLLLLVFSLSLNLVVSAHEFYFAYAEFEWNDFSETFQGTVIFTGHDLESVLDINLTSTENNLISDEDQEVLMQYMNEHLTLGEDNQLNFVGSESKLTGEFYLYLETSPFKQLSETPLLISFTLLMDQFPDQQNKLTLTYHEYKHYLVFIKGTGSETQKVILDKENNEK